jgi:hypothetical protein
MKFSRQLTAMTLVPTLIVLTGWSCSSTQVQTWLTLAEKDLPIISQEAQNIANMSDPTSSDAALIAQISTVAIATTKDVSDAIGAYKQNPSATTQQNIIAVIDKADADLPATLQSFPIKDQQTMTMVEAAVDGIILLVDVVAVQIPAPVAASANSKGSEIAAKRSARLSRANISTIPTPSQIRQQWDANVCKGDFTHCKKM